MAKPPTKPLKVIAELVDGKLSTLDGVIMLDSILYHAWFVIHAPHVLEGKGKFDARGYHIGLPLRHLHGARYAASKGVYEIVSTTIEFHSHPPNTKQPIPFKVVRVKDNIVTFYCMGDKDKILEHLATMRFIGKYNFIGIGAIKSWTVEDAEADYSLMHPAYGLMRPTPVEEAEELGIKGYPVMDYGIRPPYHKDKNQRLCLVPIPRNR